MRDNKAFASLTSGLLARKGQAKPAMRPQGFGATTGYPDDLGWNDMGHDVPRSFGVRLPSDLSGPQSALPASAGVPAVVHQQDEIAREFAEPAIEPVIEAVVAPVAEIVPEIVAEASKPAAKKASRRVKPAAVAKADVSAALRTPRETGRKAAFTLRLDAERHLRLRLACAVEHRSAQQIVTTALDQFLATLPDVERLAASLPSGKPGA